MTVLRCACGTLVEGTGEDLLAAVEEHLLDAHGDAVASASGPGREVHPDERDVEPEEVS